MPFCLPPLFLISLNLIPLCFCPYFSKLHYLPEHMQSFFPIHSSVLPSVPLSQITSVALKSHVSFRSLPTIPPHWQLDKFWFIKSHLNILTISCNTTLPSELVSPNQAHSAVVPITAPKPAHLDRSCQFMFWLQLFITTIAYL